MHRNEDFSESEYTGKVFCTFSIKTVGSNQYDTLNVIYSLIQLPWYYGKIFIALEYYPISNDIIVLL